MHPELAMSLADQHRRESLGRPRHLELADRAVPPPPVAFRPRPGRARRLVPGYRVTWTRLSLASAGAGRRRSCVIVISATRAH